MPSDDEGFDSGELEQQGHAERHREADEEDDEADAGLSGREVLHGRGDAPVFVAVRVMLVVRVIVCVIGHVRPSGAALQKYTSSPTPTGF